MIFLIEEDLQELKPLILEHYFDAVDLRCAKDIVKTSEQYSPYSVLIEPINEFTIYWPLTFIRLKI